MEYRRLGSSGLQVSALALGTMNLGGVTEKPEAFDIIDLAIDAGINLIDCADVYNAGKTEQIVGEALKKSGCRGKIFLTSKVYYPVGEEPNDRGNSRHHIIESCENSLKRLKTDYIDIYFLHRTDFSVAQVETLEALDHLRLQGKIRYAACSTHPAWRTTEAIHIAEKNGYPRFVCEQPPYNLLDRRIENEILPMCRAYDLGVVTWSPLAQGLLAGRYIDTPQFPAGSRGDIAAIYKERINAAGIEVGRKFAAHAKELGIPPSQLAVAWALHQPGITSVLLGPRSVAQLQDLLPSFELKIDEDTLDYCDLLVPPGRYATSFFNTADWMKSKGV